MSYEIVENKRFNSLEIKFSEKPNENTRNVLKSYKFRWNPNKAIWYGFANIEEIKKDLETGTKKEQPKKQKDNDFLYNVKVGDLFYCSWGYEQTNVNFFQVVKLVGKKSVRIIEVTPKLIEENPTCGMAADRRYKLPNKILPAKTSTIFVKDCENGDLKKLNSYHRDEKNNPIFHVGQGGYTCCKYDGEQLYESWYY